MSKVRFASTVLFFSVVVWTLCFWALAALVRRFPPFEGNKYPQILVDFLRQSFLEGDEELITVTCLTLWAVAWGMFFAALTFRKPTRMLKWTASCAGIIYVAWWLGAGYLRHLFSVEIDHWFHILYSIAVTAMSVIILMKSVRVPSNPRLAAPP